MCAYKLNVQVQLHYRKNKEKKYNFTTIKITIILTNNCCQKPYVYKIILAIILLLKYMQFMPLSRSTLWSLMSCVSGEMLVDDHEDT